MTMASGEPQYQTREQKRGEVSLRRDTAAEQLYGAPSSEEEFTLWAYFRGLGQVRLGPSDLRSPT